MFKENSANPLSYTFPLFGSFFVFFHHGQNLDNGVIIVNDFTLSTLPAKFLVNRIKFSGHLVDNLESCQCRRWYAKALMDMAVAYYIADTKHLNRAAKIIKNYGIRVQKLIFEVTVDDKRFMGMNTRIGYEIQSDKDEGTSLYAKNVWTALQLLGSMIQRNV